MKTIAFDLDGTLLDSRKRHVTLLHNVCRELCQPITADMLQNYLPYKQNGLNTYRYLIEKCGFSEEAAKKVSQLWIERIELSEYIAQDKLYFDSIKTLRMIEEKTDMAMVLITARKDGDLLLWQLKKLSICSFFIRIFCISPENAKGGKQLAVEQLKDLSCMVGDTEVDQLAAEHVGCPFYALHRGFRSKSFWAAAKIKSHSDLGNLILF